ncbi:MAG: response regulator, partial [Limnobacter sp.]|nr:response regulator [Limnobacter sp.]
RFDGSSFDLSSPIISKNIARIIMQKDSTPWELLDSAFESKQNSGTAAVNASTNEMAPLEGKAVLIVDSALATRRTLQDQVSQLGAKSVLFAATVSEVEQYLDTREFGLLICEYQLEGDRNGQQLLEELRVQNKLPWFTVFMMVTGERTYSNVVSVAEFAPDEYLIKPFTASSLSDRVVRTFNRKKKLARAYEAVFKGQYQAVPGICMTLEKQHPQFAHELERMRIESIIRDGRLDEAVNELEEAMAANAKPWMQLALSKIHTERKNFEAAEALLKKVVKENPEYIMATDLYAEVLWEQNKPELALQTLEKLGAKALSSTSRLRKLADLSIRVGDDVRSKNYLNKVIDRSRNSSLTQMHDYLQFAKIFTKEGRHEEAEKLTSRLRTAVNSSELNFARSLMTIQRISSEGDLAKARHRLEELFKNEKELIEKLQADAQTSLLEQCFLVGMSKEGYEMARKISKQKPGKALLDRIKFSIANQPKETTE